MISEHTWEMFDLGPFVITLHEDWESKQMTLYCEEGDWPVWEEPFYGDTIEEAKAQAAQRFLKQLEKWKKEAEALCI